MNINKKELLASITAVAVPVLAVVATAIALKFITNTVITGIVIAGIICVATPIIIAAGYKLFENFSESKNTTKKDIMEVIKEADKKELLARVSTVAVPVIAAIGAGIAINFIADTTIAIAVIAGIAAVTTAVLAPSLYETLKEKVIER